MQLYPVNEFGKCATFNANVQPACLTRDVDKFEYGTDMTEDCKISGWGDTDEETYGIQHANILQVSKTWCVIYCIWYTVYNIFHCYSSKNCLFNRTLILKKNMFAKISKFH